MGYIGLPISTKFVCRLSTEKVLWEVTAVRSSGLTIFRLEYVNERRKDSSFQLYESRLSYFKDKARINYCKPLSVYQHGGPSRPRQNCHSCIFETKENSNLRICIQYLGHHSKTTCQKSAKSMRYRVRPKFEFYRYSLLSLYSPPPLRHLKLPLPLSLRQACYSD